MNDQQINIALAVVLGWTIDPEFNYVIKPNTSLKTFRGYNDITEMFPDFCNDLNAVRNAEQKLVGETFIGGDDEDNANEYCDTKYSSYVSLLCEVCKRDENCRVFLAWNVVTSTARQRAEALLKYSSL